MRGINVKLLAGLESVVKGGLPIAEQLAIDNCGGSISDRGSLANKYRAINKQRWEALEGLKVDIDRVRAILGP